MSKSSSALYATAHGDDRDVMVRNRLNDKREVLIGTDLIELGGYMYPNKSIRRPDPLVGSHIPSLQGLWKCHLC